MAGALAGFSSCATTKQAVTAEAIDGEWNIVEIDGAAVVPAAGQEFPYIAFDVRNGKVSGSAGCNRLTGTFDTSAKRGAIDLSSVATTLMMCPDMTMEQSVLNALRRVKKYKRLEDGSLALCASKKPVIVLQERKTALALNELDGKWLIVEANGIAVPDSLKRQPFLELDISEKRVHGNIGCNQINGAFQTDEADAASISFLQLTSTMMTCPDMETENRIRKAVKEVRSFGRVAEGAGLFDAGHRLVIVLKKAE